MRAIAALVVGLLSAGAAGAQGVAEVDAWIDALSADREQALVAGRRLTDAGESAAVRVEERWDTISSIGKRRAVPVLAGIASRSARACRALSKAARDADETISREAYAALIKRGTIAHDALLELIGDPNVGDRAARWLAERAPERAIPALLTALEASDSSDRPDLRAALTTASRRKANLASSQGLSWLTRRPTARAASLAAEAFAPVAGTLAIFDAVRGYALNGADDFETRWRIARLAAQRPRWPVLDKWLVGLLGNETWMLRAAALESLAAHGELAHVRAALSDSYPRVRVAALQQLTGDDVSLVARATLARRDVWPFVRAAAISSIAPSEDASDVVIAGLGDKHSVVRAAAIDALAASPTQAADDGVVERLRFQNEWPTVTQAAIRYVRQRCLHAATDALIDITRRGLSQSASDEDQHNASRAIAALKTLGTPAGDRFLATLEGAEDAPPFVRMPLKQPGKLCTPGAAAP